MGAARDLGLDAGALIDRAAELAGTAPDAFADAARAAAIVPSDRDVPSTLSDLVVDRSTRCRQILRSRSSTELPN